MKKIVLIFLVFLMFFLVWCKENIQKQEISNKKVKCDSDKKLWINKTYNFSMCIPINWWQLSIYSWNAYSNLDIPDESESIWDGIYDEISLQWIVKNTFWKYDKKSTFWNKQIIEHYIINNNWKKEFGDFNYYLEIWKDKYYNFSFNEKTDKMKSIINSIKVLEKF